MPKQYQPGGIPLRPSQWSHFAIINMALSALCNQHSVSGGVPAGGLQSKLIRFLGRFALGFMDITPSIL